MRGFEPPTLGTTIRCSNQLSYIHHTCGFKCSAPFEDGQLRAGTAGTGGLGWVDLVTRHDLSKRKAIVELAMR